MLKLLVALCFVAAFPAFAASDSLEVVVPGKTSKFSLKQLQSQLKSETISLDDPVYHARKSFDAFRLDELLRLAGLDEKSAGDEIVFTAADGYSPNTSFEMLRKHTAFLAYEEHGMSRSFGKVAQGKAMISPAPYYVVWAEGKPLENDVPWPYQLVKIEVVDFQKKFPSLYPAGAKPDSKVMAGFRTFKNDCIRCHSINLAGGDVGPELNVPKNVTEYWSESTLREFIRDASAFRAKSKMPPFPQLTGARIDEILAYFEAMKKLKKGP